jgi:hypothetical protein
MFRAALVTATLFAAVAIADDKKPAAPDPTAIMANMQKQATPGPEHKKLDPLTGDWTYDAKFYTAPGAPPIEMSGTCKTTWVLDGRFIREEVSGKEMPFNGVGVIGYDNHSKKYVGAWIDNSSTGITTMTGEMDAAGKTLSFQYDGYDATFDKTVKMRQVIHLTGPDGYNMEFYTTPPGGKEMKSGEITYKRKK